MITVTLILFLLLLGPILLLDLLLRPKHRLGIFQKLGFLPQEILRNLQGRSPIWLHGVSVGEVNSLLPMVDAVKKKYPETPILLSVGTATGYSFAREKAQGADAVMFFPFDIPWICRRVIRRVHPKLVLITEKEIWPNFLGALKKQNIPVMWINGRLSIRSLRWYKFLKPYFRRVLSGVSYFAVDSKESLVRWIQIGADSKKVQMTGHTKVDQAFALATSLQEKPPHSLASFHQGKKIFLSASTHAGEEAELSRVFQDFLKSHDEWRWILVPRHPERFSSVADLLDRRGIKFHRLSRWNGGAPSDARPVLLVDKMGILAQLYALADVAFIGGSLVPVGGHNVWEAAVFNVPMIYGPYMKQDDGLAEAGGALCVKDAKEFPQQLLSLLTSTEKQNHLKVRMKDFLEGRQGAVQKNLKLVEEILS